MTAKECILYTSNLIKTSISNDNKVRWLSEFDGVVFDFLKGTSYEIENNKWLKHLLGNDEEDYDEDNMIIPFPYDGLYVDKLLYEIYSFLAEYDRAAYFLARYTDKYTEYKDYITRTYPPKTNTYIKTGEKYSV